MVDCTDGPAMGATGQPCRLRGDSYRPWSTASRPGADRAANQAGRGPGTAVCQWSAAVPPGVYDDRGDADRGVSPGLRADQPGRGRGNQPWAGPGDDRPTG